MSDANPYAAPEADLTRDSGGDHFTLTPPKSVSIGRGWGWIADGFGHFKMNPGAWILTMIVGLFVMIVMSVIPFVGQIALMVTYYVWAGGLMLGCHAQSNGEDFRVGHLFAGFSNNVGKLILLSVVISVAGIGIMVVAMGTAYLEIIGAGFTQNDEAVQAMVGEDPLGFVLTLLTALLFTIPLFMCAWFSPALIAINGVSVFKAMGMSFVGCIKNILPFFIYGILLGIFFILASIPLFLGLLVMMPTYFASTYAGYKDIYLE